jgi:nicotinamidase-related amidase
VAAAVSEIDISNASVVVDKTQFAMTVPEVTDALSGIESVVMCGIEAHVCILQTALELRAKGIDVHIVADGTSSQHDSDRMFAFEVCRTCMRVCGALVFDTHTHIHTHAHTLL